MYNIKLQGRSRIRRTHNYIWHRRQKQLNPIVTVGDKITKAVRSDKAEFRTGKNPTSTRTHERHSWAAVSLLRKDTHWELK